MSAAERAKAAVEAVAAGVGQGASADNLRSACVMVNDERALYLADRCLCCAIGRPDVAALCRTAAAACVEAWQESRPAADLRAEALAALEALRPLIGITDPVAASALDKRAELDMGIDTMLRGIREDEVPEVKAACYRAVLALIRWREAREVTRG